MKKLLQCHKSWLVTTIVFFTVGLILVYFSSKQFRSIAQQNDNDNNIIITSKTPIDCRMEIKAGTTRTEMENMNGISINLLPASRLSQIGFGKSHTCVLTTLEGQVKCWGYGNYGQLGDGLSFYSQPVIIPVSVIEGSDRISLLSDIAQISVGNYHSCALTSSGNVKCWGRGDYGQLGDNAFANKNHPVVVLDRKSRGPLSGIVQISSGSHHSCALTSSGNVKCWGRGEFGQLGNNALANKYYPVHVVDGNESTLPLSNVSQISAGPVRTCALMKGDMYCWGDGDEIKGRRMNYKHYPEKMTSSSNIVQIGSGKHPCGLTDNGSYITIQ